MWGIKKLTSKIGMKTMSFSIPVNLIRQWTYCPRIVYYIELMDFPVTYPTWVKQGESFHKKEAHLWQRRNLSRFGLHEGKLFLEHPVKSQEFSIHGVADMIIETEKEVFPVEFKLGSSEKRKGGVLQLVAYGIMAQENLGKECKFGFLAHGPKNLQKIAMTEPLIKGVLEKTDEIRKMMNTGIKPDSPASESQCTNCEYLNYCNDRF